jgi:hypothetical protein
LRRLGLGIAIAALGFLSCAQNARFLPVVARDFFVAAPHDDPWNAKIRNWQSRHKLDQAQPVAIAPAPDLIAGYDEFTRSLRRRIAADAVAWVQGESHRHYIPDGETDHWATLSDVVATNGDDCDGLDLLTFLLLRKLGFAQNEIFRTIVVERESGQHHMVTLWFEAGARSDPGCSIRPAWSRVAWSDSRTSPRGPRSRCSMKRGTTGSRNPAGRRP